MRTTDTLLFAHSRAIRRVLGCAAVAAALLGAMTLHTTQAHAQSGRRVCVYGVDTVNTKTNEAVDWVVDHEKGSICPTLKNGKNGIDINRAQPVEEITCEALGAWTNQSSDPCPRMADDHVYRYSTSNFSVGPGAVWKAEDRGPISNFS